MSTLVGYDVVTLTDLTESLPVTLMLESNLSQNIQTQEGNSYSPNFEEEELIITPSLFIGNEQQSIALIAERVYYKMDENGNEKQYEYVEGLTGEKIYVDNQKRLHVRKNLTGNTTIECFIENFQNKVSGNVIPLLRASNPINILFLAVNDTNYNFVITSTDGREFFDENNIANITLRADLYYGADLINSNSTSTRFSYVWDRAGDNDSATGNLNFAGDKREQVVMRSDVNATEIFSCTITDNETGMSFSATKIIRDFRDTYFCKIIANGSLVLTPDNKTLTLTNQVWSGTQIINEPDSNRFTYDWSLLKDDGSSISLGTNKNLSITVGTNNIPEKSFTICCISTIDGITTALDYINVSYQPISYSVNLSQKTLFVPVNSDGTYRGEGNFIKDFTFQLLDENKNPMPFNDGDGILSVNNSEYSLVVADAEAAPTWNFNLTFMLKTMFVDDSKSYDITYQYLGQQFTESFEVIKNYAGQNGRDGQSGYSYTIDLSNEYYSFEGQGSMAKPNQTTSFTISAFYGDDELEITSVKVGGIDELIDNNILNNGLQVSGVKNGSKVDITLRTGNPNGGETALTSAGALNLYITIKQKNSTSTKTFLKNFTYTINYTGSSYSILPSANTIVYSPSKDSYNPTSLQVNLIVSSGATTSPFTNGKLIYSVNGGTTWKLGATDTNIFTLTSSDYGNDDNIAFRLYSNVASFSQNVTTSELNAAAAYLLDIESVPIITSLEGIEIGGENLIPWSKKMPIDNGKWTSANVTIDNTDDFSKANFSSESAVLQSPVIEIYPDYLDKNFVFSCMINFSNMPTNFSIKLKASDNFDKTVNEGKTIGEFIIGNNQDFTFDKAFATGVWLKLSKVFTFPNSFITNYKYYWVTIEAANLTIKQTKLEIGNIASAWSASPYDVDYDSILGENLLSYLQSYKIEVEEGVNSKDVEFHITRNNSYTFSWKETGDRSVLTDFSISVYKENNTLIGNYNFAIGNGDSFTQNLEQGDYFLRFARTNTDTKLIVYYLKIEEGTVATPYLLDGPQVSLIAQDLEKQVNSNKESTDGQIDVILNTIEGEINTNITNLKNDVTRLSGSKVDVDGLEGKIELMTNNFLSGNPQNAEYKDKGIYFTQLRKSITMNTSAEEEPYIQISTAVGDQNTGEPQNFYVKITSTKLSFFENNKEVAYISNQVLKITKAQFLNSFTIGESNSGLLEVSVNENGVGFIWRR